MICLMKQNSHFEYNGASKCRITAGRRRQRPVVTVAHRSYAVGSGTPGSRRPEGSGNQLRNSPDETNSLEPRFTGSIASLRIGISVDAKRAATFNARDRSNPLKIDERFGFLLSHSHGRRVSHQLRHCEGRVLWGADFKAGTAPILGCASRDEKSCRSAEQKTITCHRRSVALRLRSVDQPNHRCGLDKGCGGRRAC